ncbi:hypothetical protein [Aeromonas caviae]|uniref:hypothetical protein n=1 Tax=Aeromonas caviae TaxID=648 RepID=UPI0029D60E95|nr:hypothetical protein [Aeromonas caviae]MDX7784795.1 hypothetical protein [Aeromonas caviae]
MTLSTIIYDKDGSSSAPAHLSVQSSGEVWEPLHFLTSIQRAIANLDSLQRIKPSIEPLLHYDFSNETILPEVDFINSTEYRHDIRPYERLNISEPAVLSWYHNAKLGRCEQAEKLPINENAIKNKTKSEPSEYTFIAEQEWEGVVLSRDINDGDVILAKLVDLTIDDDEDEFFEIDLSRANVYNIDVCDVGSIFRWSIGYLRHAKGTKRKYSRIDFRRLPTWTKFDIERIKNEANLLKANLCVVDSAENIKKPV